MPALSGGLAPPTQTYTMGIAGQPGGQIAQTKTFTSEVLPTYGISHVGAAGQIDQAGTLTLQLYLDSAGTIAQGAPVTKAMTANTMALIDNLSTAVASSLTIAITNSGAAAANVAAMTVVLQR